MSAPLSFTPSQAAYLEDLEARLSVLENPGDPVKLPVLASSALSTTNAAQYTYRFVYLTDLNQLGYSNGAHWYKIAVGTLIV